MGRENHLDSGRSLCELMLGKVGREMKIRVQLTNKLVVDLVISLALRGLLAIHIPYIA